MCRKYLVYAVGLLSFGVGILAGGWVESGLIRFLLGGAAICIGIMLVGEKCRHK